MRATWTNPLLVARRRAVAANLACIVGIVVATSRATADDGLSAVIDDIVLRYEAIPLRTSHAPSVICHGLLGHDGDYGIFDDDAGEYVSALDHLLLSYEGTLTDRLGVRFRRDAGEFRFERHRAQFTAYICQSVQPDEIALGSRASWREGLLVSIWEREKLEHHGLREVGWFLPAHARLGALGPFENKFGERIDPRFLVQQVLAQLTRPDAGAIPCGGTHLLMALAAARSRLSAVLDDHTRLLVDAAWTDERDRVLTCVSPEGTFDLKAYFGRIPPPAEYEAYSAYVAGHVIEALAESEDPAATHDHRFKAWVRATAAQVCDLDAWRDTTLLFNPGSAFNYGAASHLVSGLRQYRANTAERTASRSSRVGDCAAGGPAGP